MEKKEIIIYFEICRHYFSVLDEFIKTESPSDDVHLTIYQKDLVGAAAHLMEYSRALHNSIISSCVDNLLVGKKFYDSSKFDINDIKL